MKDVFVIKEGDVVIMHPDGSMELDKITIEKKCLAKSEYKYAQEDLLSAKGVIHLIGDFGVGKTHLINSLKESEEHVLFDDFVFKDSEYGAIRQYRVGVDFSETTKKVEGFKRMQKWAGILIGALASTSPLSFILSKDVEAWQFIPVILLAILIIYWFCINLKLKNFNKFPDEEKYKNLYIENIDRYDWDTIYLLFKWAYKNKSWYKKIVFTYAADNISERYKEKYSFYPKNLQILLDKFVTEYIDLNLYKNDVAHIILGEILKNYEGWEVEAEITGIKDFNFRLVEKSLKFMDENKAIIKQLQLNSKAVFLVQYLSHHHKHGYYWLKDNITFLQSSESNWNKRAWFEKIDGWEQKVDSDKIKQDSTPIELIESEEIIRMIYSVLNLQKYQDEQIAQEDVWENYFINSATKDSSALIARKDVDGIIGAVGMNPALKKSELIKLFNLKGKEEKEKIFKFIIEKKEFGDGAFIIENFKTVFNNVPTTHMPFWISELWYWGTKNYKFGDKVNKNITNNYSISPYILRELLYIVDDDKDVDFEIVHLLKWAINIYWNNLKLQKIDKWDVIREWYIYEMLILQKIFNREDKDEAYKLLRSSREIWFAGIYFDSLDPIKSMDIAWRVPSYSPQAKHVADDDDFKKYFDLGQNGLKEIKEIVASWEKMNS